MNEKEHPSASAPSLSSIVFKSVCGQLEKSLRDEKASASFACGGTIPVKCTDAANPSNIIDEDVPEPGEKLKPSGPVNIFWELKDESAARKLTLPHDSSVKANDSANSLTRLRQLVTDCEPASFGRHQEAVLDTQYRKAGKLDTHKFATTFHPADFGIIERVEQVLHPTLQNLTEQFLEIRRLEIELYKLNVYSGPSGLFKSHVDTPRSKNQIGSLVVCLPSAFKGGNLIVFHEDRAVDFDWEHRSSDTIQWAAFYSDCEHEIKMVDQGERITLTYNIYTVTELFDKANRVSAVVNPKSYPMYQDLKNLLQIPGFMKTGGVLGAFCSHAYPHASNDASALLPRGLKGADLALYSVLQTLGVEVDVLPVMIGCGHKDIDHYCDRNSSVERERQCEYEQEYNKERELAQFGHTINPDEGNDGDGDDSQGNDPDRNTSSDADDDIDTNESKRYKFRRRNRPNDDTLTYYDPGYKVRIGESLYPHVAAETYDDQWFSEFLKEHWPTRCYERPVTWIAAPKRENMQEAMTYLTYGNEPGLDIAYSYATIIAVIPPWNERQKLLAKLEDAQGLTSKIIRISIKTMGSCLEFACSWFSLDDVALSDNQFVKKIFVKLFVEGHHFREFFVESPY